MTLPGHNPKSRVQGSLAVLALALLLAGCSTAPRLEYWHTEKLTEEFGLGRSGQHVDTFDDYLRLEDRLFEQLDSEVYARTPTGPEYALNRYSSGSAADPRSRRPDWNRSFELRGSGAGGVLLLHGMSDSPYSLRALGESLNRRGYHVVGLRLPGHGTAPSGLRYVSWQDMAAAVDLAYAHLRTTPGSESAPIHLIGYSTGASLALDLTLRAFEGANHTVPASLTLISPAVRIHGAARLAGFKDSLSAVPGLAGLSWLTVMAEFDPYKYNSFATNAGKQVHRVTTSVDRRLATLARDDVAMREFPPVLVLKSTVDSTVTTEAVVDNLLLRLPAHRNELVLFDINRRAALQATALVSDPAPLTDRLLGAGDLPFTVRFITNEHPESSNVVVRSKPPFTAEPASGEPIGLAWPAGVVSLSHVALPIPNDDPLYGQVPPSDSQHIYLGDLALRGERGLLKVPPDWLLRMRYNPFYDYLEQRVVDWLETRATP